MCDSGIVSMNIIILNEFKKIVNDCNILGISFIESNDKVMEGVCDMIRGD